MSVSVGHGYYTVVWVTDNIALQLRYKVEIADHDLMQCKLEQVRPLDLHFSIYRSAKTSTWWNTMVKSYWNIRLIWTPSRILGSIIYIFYEDVLFSAKKREEKKCRSHDRRARCVNYSLRGHVPPTFWRVKKWNGSKTKNPLIINSESYQLLIFSLDYQVNTTALVESCPKWPNLGIKLLPKYGQLSTKKVFIYQA